MGGLFPTCCVYSPTDAKKFLELQIGNPFSQGSDHVGDGGGSQNRGYFFRGSILIRIIVFGAYIGVSLFWESTRGALCT